MRRYLDEDVHVAMRVPGEPHTVLFINPSARELGLRVHTTSEDRPPETNLRHLVARRAWNGGHHCLEVVVTDPALYRDAYPLLCAMSDRIQLDGMRPADALRLTLRQLALLLQRTERFSLEREIGLFGELLVLGGMIGSLGADDAVRAWRGSASEEHDFGLATLDVEVKTTSGEKRAHWIESWTQLLPTGDRPLWLVSHQLTQAGLGSGALLPELIDAVRRAVGAGAAGDEFEARLVAVGWTDRLAPTCDTRWTKRTPSLAYEVHGGFPRLTRDGFAAGTAGLVHVPEIKYRVDLTGYAHDVPVDALRPALAFEGQ
ncbi:PD-(D/E)XK motif protein [Saccharothrix sp. NRRL B-16348]|uniref:PD-(D/E)XK motif protein n=1 Tax=Saccharothrix sp. NRRL B-16348 TaxID=1415542 RepID=UPI0012FAD6BE|nr:PD-(D/E)XK motif protein [Saccharothrix sp. NRRL B-16348]